MVSFFGTETSPSSGSSSPTTMRKRVVLPEPLGPTSPTFSPGFNWKDASTKINCLPYCLWIFEKEIIRNTKLAEGRQILRRHVASPWRTHTSRVRAPRRWMGFFEMLRLTRKRCIDDIHG